MTDRIDCQAARRELTESLLLGRPVPERLARHAASCAGCAVVLDEVSDVVRLLRSAEPPTGVVRASAPPSLGSRIARDVGSARRKQRNRLVLASVAAVCCLGILTPVAVQALNHAGQAQAVASQVHLARTGTMIEQPWGTEVPVVLSDVQPGQVYRLMTQDSAGNRTPAGTVRAAGSGPIRADMVTAMSRNAIAVLVVDDDQGRQVATMPVTRYSAPPTS